MNRAFGHFTCYDNRRATMTALKITQIGNPRGLILPKEILARPKVGKGDSVFVTDTGGPLPAHFRASSWP